MGLREEGGLYICALRYLTPNPLPPPLREIMCPGYSAGIAKSKHLVALQVRLAQIRRSKTRSSR